MNLLKLLGILLAQFHDRLHIYFIESREHGSRLLGLKQIAQPLWHVERVMGTRFSTRSPTAMAIA
jgi:hypothetical protein